MKRVGTSLLLIAGALMILVSNAAAQDLGSMNKLFGGGSTKKSTATKKPASTSAKKKPAAARPRPTSATAAGNTDKKRSRGSAQSRNTTTKTSREITTPTGAKITKPETKPQDVKAAPDTKRFSAFVAPQNKIVDKKLSSAEEARFEELIQQGNTARDEREYGKAELAYKSARAMKSRDARAIYGLGNVYSDQQRWEDAENSYRAALQLDASSPMTLIALSYVLTQPLPVENLSDRYAEAEKLARRAAELSPRNALAYNQLGVALEGRGEIGTETENAYRKAIQLDPNFAPTYAYLGRLLRRRGMLEEAKESYAHAVERATDVGTMVVVAEVMQSEQRYVDSIPLLKEATTADPRNPSALLMLGRALTVAGEYKDAEVALQKALAIDPGGYRANNLLASLYARQGAYELAENALLQAVRSAPPYENRQLSQQFAAIGRGYSKMGKTQQAQRAYAKAAELDPDNNVLTGRFRQ